MKLLLLASALSASLILGGCVIKIDDGYDSRNHQYSDWEKRQNINRQYITDLELNTSSDVVKLSLGAADFNEVFEVESDKVQILYYRTQRTEDDGITTKDECTPLVFVNGTLKGWGQSALSRYL